MKWIKAYYIGADEIVQCPIDDERVDELRRGGAFLDKNVVLGDQPWPDRPIVLSGVGYLYIFDVRSRA